MVSLGPEHLGDRRVDDLARRPRLRAPGRLMSRSNRVHHGPDPVLGSPWRRESRHPTRRDGGVLLDEPAHHGIEAGTAKVRPGARPSEDIVVDAERHRRVTRNARRGFSHGGRMGTGAYPRLIIGP